MPVTEQNSTVRIAFFNEKIFQKYSVCYCKDCKNQASN